MVLCHIPTISQGGGGVRDAIDRCIMTGRTIHTQTISEPYMSTEGHKMHNNSNKVDSRMMKCSIG